MPTKSFASALLLLTADDPSLPWGSPAWQMLTSIGGNPWTYDESKDDANLSTFVKQWTIGVAKEVGTFVNNVLGLSKASERDKHVTFKSTDNDSAGRTAWATFTKNGMGEWGLNKIVDELLEEVDRTPQSVCRILGNGEHLPFAEHAQIYQHVDRLAVKIFGEDAFVDDSTLVKPHISSFAKNLMTIAWNRYRKMVVRDSQYMRKRYTQVTQTWQAFSAEGANPDAKGIRTYMELLRSLLKLYKKYDNKEHRDAVEKYMADVQEMNRIVRKEPGSEKSTKIPKVLRDALSSLASEEDIRLITQDLLLAMEDTEAADNDERIELDWSDDIEVEWKEGVEALAKFTEDEMWAKLGLPEKRLPFFQRWTDSDGTIDPWSDEGQVWLKSDHPTRQQLHPRWHQLVGIYRMLERAFDNKPVLLMDGVGLGKTLQVLGAICCLASYRQVYQQKGKFPGDFADRKFAGTDSNIPDFPQIIVCPVNLRQQWETEIKRFIVPNAFDLLPYTGRHATRSDWWTALYSQSKQPFAQRLILTTHTAVQDDAMLVFEIPNMKEKVSMATPSARFQSKSPQTIYGQRYGFVVMDEAHCARKHNHIHRAFRGLRERTSILVAMTATPVTTKAQDLFIMGQWMGIPGFDDFKEFLQLSKEINRANRQDSKAFRDAGLEGNVIRGVFIGKRNPKAPELVSPGVTRAWMIKIRQRFAVHVIRRTIDSVDYLNSKLFGMHPYREHVLKLQMYDSEMVALRCLAKDLVKENPIASADTRKNFYIEFRRSMLHPSLNPKSGTHWSRPKSLEDWSRPENITVKLDILAHIVKYHLTEDGRAPLTVSDNGRTIVTNSDEESDENEYAESDRIIIYSAFPSSNQAIIDILELYDIEVVELHGSLSMKKRQEALDTFRAATAEKGPRVLIISNVGMVGLNLACANIMVFVDTTWSAQDDEQLRGRIFRYPQMKQVHFYRLIALDTPDVFLNNISFDKGQLHSAFVGCSDEIKDLFERPTADEDDTVLSLTDADGDGALGSDDEMEVDQTPQVKPKPKPKGKGKGRATKSKKSKENVQSDAEDDVPSLIPGPSTSAPKKTKKRTASTPTSPPKKQTKRSRKGTVTQSSVAQDSVTNDSAISTASPDAMEVEQDPSVAGINTDDVGAPQRAMATMTIDEQSPDADDAIAETFLRGEIGAGRSRADSTSSLTPPPPSDNEIAQGESSTVEFSGRHRRDPSPDHVDAVEFRSGAHAGSLAQNKFGGGGKKRVTTGRKYGGKRSAKN